MKLLEPRIRQLRLQQRHLMTSMEEIPDVSGDLIPAIIGARNRNWWTVSQSSMVKIDAKKFEILQKLLWIITGASQGVGCPQLHRIRRIAGRGASCGELDPDGSLENYGYDHIHI